MRLTAGLVGLVALASAALGWLQNPDHITAQEARTAAEEAFEAAGIDGAIVDPDPVAGHYTAPGDDQRVRVWKASATLESATVELWLSRSDGEAVFLDDRTPDGAGQLLTEAQFRRLADYHDNPAVDRQIRRNIALTAAAALILILAIRFMAVAARAAASGAALLPARQEKRRSPRPGLGNRARVVATARRAVGFARWAADRTGSAARSLRGPGSRRVAAAPALTSAAVLDRPRRERPLRAHPLQAAEESP